MDTPTAHNTSWPEIITLLSNLVVFKQYDFNEFLKRLITIANNVVPTDSCFIYLHDKEKKRLTLIASKKPHADAIGNVSMHEGEGITGWVAEHKQAVAISQEAYKDTRFKFFKELPEDKYEAFLSIPILDETGVVGVINFQNRTPYLFTQEQIKAIEGVAKIIASAFAKTVLERQITTLQEKLDERKVVEKAKGVLMKVKNLSEEEAFKLIRSESMNKRKSMKEIAEAILLVW